MGIFDKFGKKAEEKPRADFSNVQSGSSSTAAEPSKPSSLPDLGPGPNAGSTGAAGASGQDQSYVVVSGDSLSKIAKRFYGDAAKWPRIHEANRDQIKDPDLIHPGQRLKIPSA